MPAYLSEIVAAHRRMAAADRRDLGDLVARALEAPATRSFARALRSDAAGLSVIAEVKRRSPSKGALAAELDPAEVAGAYAAGGAACLSVLTDEAFFGGSAADLAAARSASGLPVLRKDFTVAAADVCDARLMGADAVLLIVAVLSDDELASLYELAGRLGLDALVEVHDEPELERALALGPRLVGVNQRDLATFELDPLRALRLVSAIPPGVAAVAESGIRGPDDARRLARAGYDAILVGESVVTSEDPSAAVRALLGHPVGRRGTSASAAADARRVTA
ncbi:MAG: indole-3-glycerol phosphate synthase TrpC [Acidimicrobiales bacterium]